VVLRLDNKNLPLSHRPWALIERGLRCHPKDSVRVEREQSVGRPCGRDISLRERLLPCRAVQRGEMLLADGICTSLEQPLSLIAVEALQGGKQSDVAGLELVGGVGGEATVENVVCETKLLGFEGLVRSEALGALN
jgi:hypothetical protein